MTAVRDQPGEPLQQTGSGSRVTAVIVSFNTVEQTMACLDSLQHVQLDLRIVLVDNASSDGSAAAVAQRYPEVTVIRSQENLGFARAVNLGVEQAPDGFVLLLNPDTTVPPGSLEAMVGFAGEHPDYRVYGGRTLGSDGHLDPSSCWGKPTIWSLTCYAAGLSTAFKGSKWFDPESLGRWPRDTVQTVPVITGCLLLIARHDFLAIGGMDEVYFLYGEDAAFSRHAWQHGMRPVIVPDAVIVHDNGGSTGGGGRKMCMVMAGKSTYVRREWPGPRALVGIQLLQVGALLRFTLERATGRRDGMWTEVWRRRRDWRDGYPKAKQALFGSASAPRT